MVRERIGEGGRERQRERREGEGERERQRRGRGGGGGRGREREQHCMHAKLFSVCKSEQRLQVCCESLYYRLRIT